MVPLEGYIPANYDKSIVGQLFSQRHIYTDNANGTIVGLSTFVCQLENVL